MEAEHAPNSGGGSNTIGETQAFNNAGCFGLSKKVNAVNFGGGDDYILCEILSRLPVKSLTKFKAACKPWRFLIEHDQHFIDLHHKRSEARQQQQHTESTTTVTLFVSPVMTLSSPSMERTGRTKEDDVYREIKMILLSHNNLGGGGGSSGVPPAPVQTFNSNITLLVPRKKASIELVSSHTATLEPVHGLVCFVNLNNYGSVLIYNPSIRERTEWIRTRTSGYLEGVFLAQAQSIEAQPDKNKPLDVKTWYRCMFGFGFDSATKQHKVLCIYQIDQIKIRAHNVENDDWPERDRYVGTYCEVMTVGQNIWRPIDDIPSFVENLQIERQCKSVHVNGYICWMSYYVGDDGEHSFRDWNDVIMVFDVGSETFGTISIPTVVLEDIWRLSWEERMRKWTNEVVEIDGHIAILNIKKCEGGQHWVDLWILEDDIKINCTSDDATNNNVTTDGCNCGNWILEILRMPCLWEEIRYLAFKAISGTDLIIIKYFVNSYLHEPAKNEVLYCYDRKKKISYKKQVDMIMDDNRPYDITTFFDTLTRVQTEGYEAAVIPW